MSIKFSLYDVFEDKNKPKKYSGDDICFEEMPNGCVISKKDSSPAETIIVSSSQDAIFLIESLKKMLRLQQPEVWDKYLDYYNKQF